MTNNQRIKEVQLFVDSAKYLKGAVYRVIWLHGAPRIEFKSITPEQTRQLREELDDSACEHIKIVNLDKKKARRRRKKNRDKV